MSKNPQLRTIIERFFTSKVNVNPIYNEFSLQHELGIFLRGELPKEWKIQFERPVNFFDLSAKEFEKKEIDICVFKRNGKRIQEKLAAIELKFPRSGRVPESMFDVCKDIRFLEQLVSCKKGFKEGYSVFCADNHLFYEYKQGDKKDGVYRYFRKEIGKPLTGKVTKPTGSKGKVLNFGSNRYPIYENWGEVKNRSLYENEVRQIKFVITKAKPAKGTAQ